MKKLLALTLVGSMVLSFTGCFGGGVKLEEGQIHYTLTDKGEMTMEAYMEDKDLEDAFDIDFEDKEKDIIKDIEEYFDDEDIDVTVKKFSKKKDFATVVIVIDDAEEMMMDASNTLEDTADDYGYDDIETFADDMSYKFVTFKDEDKVKNKDLDDYADLLMISVNGGDEGSYFTLPGDIKLVQDMKYTFTSKDTIFVEDGEYGFVLFEEK